VAHFDTTARRPQSAWVRGANAFLPERIAVQWAVEVADDFSARYSALSRRYIYLLYCHPVRPALLASGSGWYHAPLDAERMREAARCLLGRHDFSAFRSSQCQAKSPVRSLTGLAIEPCGAYLRFDLTADAFLHHMVRNLVGCLLYVGAGRQPAAWLEDVLHSRDRGRAAPTLSARGLYLAEVGYEARWRLPSFPRIMPFPLP
jgi:tRNA pseudouridine38-40 synthase